eukprot:4252973-Prymnesium_polylepis.1
MGEDAAATKVQALMRGKQARAGLASVEGGATATDGEGAAEAGGGVTDADGAPEEAAPPGEGAADEGGVSAQEAAGQDEAELEAAAVRLQAIQRGRDARKAAAA